jgi:hypothetical protein
MYINRNAVVIKAKQPFVDWVNSTPKAQEEKEHVFTLAEINADCEVLLIPDCESLEEAAEDIRPLKMDIFGDALDDWETDENYWPVNRDEETFDKWFELEIHSMVDDTVEEPIVRDEPEEE